MKIIYNKILPFTGFKAINLFGILFVRKGAKMSEYDIIHEEIHSAQIKEMLYVFFYLWYVVEWLVYLIRYRDTNAAYRNIAFEKEAYGHMYDESYLKNRKPFNWIRL